MKNFSFLKNIFFAVAAIAFVVACDNDYDLLGSDVVDGDIHSDLLSTNPNLIAYDLKTGAVQTSNIATNLLGSYKSVFGRVTASYVTQVQLASVAPTFTENISVDSAWVYVPYASTQTGSQTNTTTDELDNIYKINSQYGDTLSANKFKLRITENKYFIRGTDAATGGTDSQYYYSDDDVSLFAANQGQSLLKGGTQDTIITFSNKEIKRRAGYTNDAGEPKTAIAERLAPGLFFHLDTNFFKNKVLDPARASQLSTNAAFADYFRGVSFWASAYNDDTTMLAPNFTSGYIKVIYNQDVFSNGQPVLEKDENGNNIIDPATGLPKRKRNHLTMTINLRGNHVNFFDTQDNGDYLAGVTTSDAANGDDRIYLRGGAGSMAVLDIFSGTQIQDLRDAKALINEARLTFYVDETTGFARKSDIPQRIYLYDLTNKRPLYDYSIDGSTTSNTKLSKYIYGGIYDTVKKAYTIRLTNHVSNLVKYQDSTNVKLGLVLTDDISVYTNQQLKTPLTEGTTAIKAIPTANVITPLGVKLYGSNIPVGDPNYDKRLKLEIYYTKPDLED
jgi:hypothetical protein